MLLLDEATSALDSKN